MLSIVQTIDHGKQAADDAVSWVEAKQDANSASRPEQRFAYRAGFEAGWRAAIADMKLHGYTFST